MAARGKPKENLTSPMKGALLLKPGLWYVCLVSRQTF